MLLSTCKATNVKDLHDMYVSFVSTVFELLPDVSMGIL